MKLFPHMRSCENLMIICTETSHRKCCMILFSLLKLFNNCVVVLVWNCLGCGPWLILIFQIDYFHIECNDNLRLRE